MQVHSAKNKKAIGQAEQDLNLPRSASKVFGQSPRNVTHFCLQWRGKWEVPAGQVNSKGSLPWS